MKDSSQTQLSIVETNSTQDSIKAHEAQTTSKAHRDASQRNAVNRERVSLAAGPVSSTAGNAHSRSAKSHDVRAQPTDVPRVMLTIGEAARSLGVSTDTFRRFVLPELRVVRASPRLTLVRVAELDRWASRREALADLD